MAEEPLNPSPPLKARHKMFADEWLTGEHTGKQFNATAAYVYCGYADQAVNPTGNASKLLRHPRVAEYIATQMDEYSMQPSEVLLRLTSIARSETGDVVALGPLGKLKLDEEAVIENKQFISKFGFDSAGQPKVEFHDPVGALRDIARIHGMTKEGGTTINAPGGAGASFVVNFISPDGEQVQLQPHDPDVPEPEDFSEFDLDNED